MAMTPFSRNDDDDGGVMNEINMMPLVDVMLVLLIIFLVTPPILHHAVKIDLPQASSQRENLKPAHVDVSIASDGSLRWDGQTVAPDALKARMEEAARAVPQPELHLRADRKVAYEHVAEVMSDAQAEGLRRIGFVTEPRKP